MEKVILSKELIKRLKKIGDNPIAEKLLNSTSSELNYLGVSKEDKTKMSYISNERLARYGKYRRWRPNLRVVGRPAKIAGALVDCSLPELEEFNNKFISSAPRKNTEVKFKLLSGEKIRWGYLENNYFKTDGSLGESCMRYKTTQAFLDIYCLNPTHVRLAVLLEERRVKARSIIWYPNSIKDKSIIYFDRVYAIDNDTELHMIELLRQKGFIQISQKNIIKPKSVPNIKIHLPNLDLKYWPYMDTLSSIYRSEHINNLEIGDSLTSTSGNRDKMTCDRCGDEIDEVITIEYGPGGGNHVCEDCSAYSERNNGYIQANYAIYCQFTDDNVLSSQTVTLYNGVRCSDEYSDLETDNKNRYFISGDENFIKIEDDYYHKDSPLIEERDGEYYLKQDNEEIIQEPIPIKNLTYANVEDYFADIFNATYENGLYRLVRHEEVNNP